MRLPEFIIGGAPRSGTTWLYHLLARHPGVHMAAPARPEPKFFLVDELYAKGLDWYSSRWFQAAPADTVCGEKSTNYLESPDAARRIATDVPRVKLVFILRDPAERAWSNYLWSRMNGMENETFERALELEPQRERDLAPELRFARPHAYFSRGLYAEQLQPWFDLFPHDGILCLRCEDIGAQPRVLAERLHRFIGVPVRAGDADGLGMINVADSEGQEQPPAETSALLRARYAEPNRRLAELLGPQFEIWP
ncbi:MAG TPA: sulfotransferase domain-containing protein [Burkholderiales bacterium]|nr:sulfotransferase domain-containing protein [Burkholderiales bacterium]